MCCSDDLFSDQRKCTVFAGDLPELEEALSQSLQVGVGVYVLVRFPAQLLSMIKLGCLRTCTRKPPLTYI